LLGIISASSGGITGVTVQNGRIRGFIAPVWPGASSSTSTTINTSWTLRDLLIDIGNGAVANIDLGSYSRMSNVTSPDITIRISCPSVVVNSAVHSIVTLGGFGTCSTVNNATAF
jgi:hypothetical protein